MVAKIRAALLLCTVLIALQGASAATGGPRAAEYESLYDLIRLKGSGTHTDIFFQAANATGLYDTIMLMNFRGTILVPTDDAFIALARTWGISSLEEVLMNKDLLKSVLQYHISSKVFDRIEAFTSFEYTTLFKPLSLRPLFKGVEAGGSTFVGMHGERSAARFLNTPGYLNGLIGTNGDNPPSTIDVRMAVWAIDEVLLPDIQYPKPQPQPPTNSTPKPGLVTEAGINVGQQDASKQQAVTGTITASPSDSSTGGSGAVGVTSVTSAPAPAPTNAAAAAQAHRMLVPLLAAAAAALLL